MSMRAAATALALGVLLVTCEARAQSLGDDPPIPPGAGTKTPAIDPRLGSIAGSQELYDLAEQIMTELTTRYGGDPQKMSAALERAKRDPAGFASQLSPATRDRLKALADKVPAQ